MYKKIQAFFIGTSIIAMGFMNQTIAQPAAQSDGLDTKQQSIVAISALTARGDLESLKVALNSGLDTGLSINEIKEVLIQLYAYTGFPRSLNGIITFESVMTDRQTRGINDPVGEAPKAMRTDKTKYDTGRDNLAILTGIQPPAKPTGYAAFVPTIEVFLKEHLFADIFERGVLDYQTRELVTVTALASMDGVNSQLRSHMNVAMHNGLTEPQIRNIMTIIAAKVGQSQADNANTVFTQLLVEKRKPKTS